MNELEMPLNEIQYARQMAFRKIIETKKKVCNNLETTVTIVTGNIE